MDSPPYSDSGGSDASSIPPLSISGVTHFRLQDISPFDRFIESLMFWRVATKVSDKQLSLEKRARELILKRVSIESFPDDARPVHEVVLQSFESGHHDEINKLKGDEAQVALNAMQEILRCWQPDDHSESDPGVSQEARWLLLRRLQKLACEASLLPSLLYIDGVECQGRESLGKGGFADVFRGTYNGDVVAVKHLRTFNMVKATEEPKVKRLFYREAMLWFNLDHKHILRFEGISEGLDWASGPCMVLQWAENKDLSRYLDGLISKGLTGPEYVRKVHRWICEIALGLQYLHSHDIAHSDLRAVNVLVDKDETVLLADFGLSVIANVGTSFTNHYAAKSGGWTAPELLKSTNEHDEPLRPSCESDMYSFGCVCVELFSNDPPYGKLHDYEIIPKVLRGKHPKRPRIPGRDLSDSLWVFMKTCWAPKPSKRPTASYAVKTLSNIAGYT